jgi:CubicO group peptidase (beta-lactamase class C family)
MKTSSICVALSILAVAACGPRLQAAEPAPNPAGHWEGAIVLPNAALGVQVDLAPAAGGAWQGTIDIPAQGTHGFVLNPVKVDGTAVVFGMPGVPGDPLFTGHLAEDNQSITGEFTQGGQKFPFNVKRATHPAAAGGVAPAAVNFKWLVLSPIPVGPAGGKSDPDEDAQKKAFAADLLAAQGGEAQIQPKVGSKCSINGVEVEWKAVAPVDDEVTLNSPEQRENFQIAYAAAEFDVPAGTQAWLGVGSDDGVRVWLNGALVHEHWIGRALSLDDDVVKVTLKAGPNRLLLKVQNMTGGWGFACRLMDAKAKAERLVAAARSGDLAALKDLTGQGFDVNGQSSGGLTPYLAARIGGQKEAAEFLATQGADTKATLPAPEALVDNLLKSRISPDGAAAAVLVARNGKILFEKAYGLADIERKVPATVDTKFRIGSVTKQFTAAGILRLQQAGKLKVTDTLAKYFPDFPRGGEVTLQRLLTHTSGIHSYTDGVGFMQTVTKPTTTAEMIETIKKFPFDFNPGVRWSYSNSGYFILGAILEKVSGKDYGTFLQETLFAPLGLKATGVYRNSQPPSGAAVGYEFSDGHFKKALDWDMSQAGGAGAIYSTVNDLYLWNEAVFGGKVLGKADLAAAFTPVVTDENKNDKHDEGYGYGWMIGRFRGTREISHGGGLQGFLSNLLRYPDKDFTVVVLVNASPPKPRTDPGTLSREIAEIYLGAELAAPVKAAPLQAAAVAEAALEAVVGRYDYRSAYMVVTREGNRVFGQLGGQPKFEIFPKSETEFFWKVVDAQVTFVKDTTGKVVEAIHHQGGQTLHAPRVEEVAGIKLSDAQTNPLLGDYDFKPVGKMTIGREDGVMYAELTGQFKLELGATSDTEFFTKMVNARLTFVKGADGKVTKLILHQGGQDVEMPRMVQP